MVHTYERTAEVLADSARLAELYAGRLERAGEHSAAEAEHHVAAWAQAAARRAREAAKRTRVTTRGARSPADQPPGPAP